MDVSRKQCSFFKRMGVCKENPEIISDPLVISNKSQTNFICCQRFSLLEPSKATCCYSSEATILLCFWNDQLLKLNLNGLKETRELSEAELRPRTLEMTADMFSVPVQCHALYPVCLCTWTLRHKQWIFLIEFVLFCLRWMQAHTWCKLQLIILWGLVHIFAYALSVDHQDYSIKSLQWL